MHGTTIKIILQSVQNQTTECCNLVSDIGRYRLKSRLGG